MIKAKRSEIECKDEGSCHETYSSKNLDSYPRGRRETSPNVERSPPACSDGSKPPAMTLGRPLHSLMGEFDKFVPDMDIPRFLRENDATLRFPEKVRGALRCQETSQEPMALTLYLVLQLMLLIVQAEREALDNGRNQQTACLAWTQNGKGIILRNMDEFQSKILNLVSCGAKFSSFTRKLYRWGFRQDRRSYDKAKKKKEKVFCHPLFQRDHRQLTVEMKSVTAEGSRKASAAQSLAEKQVQWSNVGEQQAQWPNHLRDQAFSDTMDQHPTIERQSSLSRSVLLPPTSSHLSSFSNLQLSGTLQTLPNLTPLLSANHLGLLGNIRDQRLGLASNCNVLPRLAAVSSTNLHPTGILPETRRLLLQHAMLAGHDSFPGQTLPLLPISFTQSNFVSPTSDIPANRPFSEQLSNEWLCLLLPTLQQQRRSNTDSGANNGYDASIL